MARRRISVERIKEVIRYGVTSGLSERAIGRALKVSRTAVAKYLEWFRDSGLTWEQAQELPDSKLLAVLEGQRVTQTSALYCPPLQDRTIPRVALYSRNGWLIDLPILLRLHCLSAVCQHCPRTKLFYKGRESPCALSQSRRI